MRKNIKPWALVAFLAVISIPSVSLLAAEKKPMTFVDAINLKRISSLRLSPDSSQLLFTQSEANWKRNRTISHIWRMNTDGIADPEKLGDAGLECRRTHDELACHPNRQV